MNHLPVDDIARYTGATRVGSLAEGSVSHLLIDSRKLLFPDSTLFFAIRTDRGDGHLYVEDLYRKGVRHFVVEKIPELSTLPEASFYLTPDVVQVLQKLAATHRMQFDIPVIGITGSNGKTIVKEWLYHVLHAAKNIVRSPRSYNSQLGVPLSVWQLSPEHELGIFEAGVSKKGEMQNLNSIIRPTIGIMTNIGDAHSEGFDSLAQKLEEKCSFFEGADTVVYCKDHANIDLQLNAMLASGKIKQLLSWGKQAGANIRLCNTETKGVQTILHVEEEGACTQFSIPFQDQAAIENAMHCYTTARLLEIDQALLKSLEDLPPLQMRLELKEGQQGCTLINDSYNADLTGVVSAIEYMALQQETKQRTVVLSAISGINGPPSAAYQQIARLLQLKGVRKLFAVGKAFSEHLHFFREAGMEVSFHEETAFLLKDPALLSLRNELVLIKGARKYGLEQVSQRLESKNHQTRLEVDLSAIASNFNQFKETMGPDTKIMAMVKAFSYGAGSFEVANLLQFYHVDQIAVAYVDEGVELRKAGITVPIMVMNTELQGFQSLVDHNLEPELYSMEIIAALHAYLKAEGISFFPVHLKLDTGMHRLGLDAADCTVFLGKYALAREFSIKSVFTHLVAAEDPASDDFTHQQLDRFEQMCGMIQAGLGYHFIRHAANTAASVRHPRAAYEMVRLGIGMYGIDTGKSGLLLQESVSLKTTIAQIRKVAKGESVGYGRKAIVEQDSLIATIRIGYADGFPRTLGNGNGRVWIAGKTYPVIGNVCMDMTMIDITESSGIGLEEEVLIFGPVHSIVQVAKDAGTIPYEIMTGISQRVPRLYLSA